MPGRTKFIRFLIILGSQTKKFGWVHLQDDGSISVGLSDKAFIAPEFKVRRMLFNYYHRVISAYLVPHTPDALEPVKNPHFTFHPPIWFHLRANREEAIFAGIADVKEVTKGHEGRFQWLRLASKPVEDLPDYGGTRRPDLTDLVRIPAPAPRCSIGIGIDFVSPLENRRSHGLLNRYEEWQGRRLHIFAETVPIQDVTTLGWFHEC